MSSVPVFNTVNLLLGRRGTGKTVFVTGEDGIVQDNLIDIYVQKEMKVLILDTYDHPSYQQVKRILPEQINDSWKKGVYRCFVRPAEMEDLLSVVYDNFWNGALILEDAFKHQKKNLSDNCANMVGDSKNRNVDMYFMYHTWSFVPLDLYRYLDFIELFKTKTPPGKREENELADNYEDVLAAYERVRNHESRFYHETINVEQ
jgi:hypothetical protein